MKREVMRTLGRQSHIFKDPLELQRVAGRGLSLKQGWICTDLNLARLWALFGTLWLLHLLLCSEALEQEGT